MSAQNKIRLVTQQHENAIEPVVIRLTRIEAEIEAEIALQGRMQAEARITEEIQAKLHAERQALENLNERIAADQLARIAIENRIRLENEALALVNAKATSKVVAVDENIEATLLARMRVGKEQQNRALAEQKLRDENHRRWCESMLAHGVSLQAAY